VHKLFITAAFTAAVAAAAPAHAWSWKEPFAAFSLRSPGDAPIYSTTDYNGPMPRNPLGLPGIYYGAQPALTQSQLAKANKARLTATKQDDIRVTVKQGVNGAPAHFKFYHPNGSVVDAYGAKTLFHSDRGNTTQYGGNGLCQGSSTGPNSTC
jgi:hypothetical protein